MPDDFDDEFSLLDGSDTCAAALDGSHEAPAETADPTNIFPDWIPPGTPANEPEPMAGPSPKPVRPGQRKGSFLYFDLETVPDFDRLELFGLPPIPEPVPVLPLVDCPDPKSVLGGTVPDAKAALAKVNGCAEWLDTLETIEGSMPKPRLGVLDAIAAARNSGDSHAAAVAERNKLLSTTPEFCRVAAMGYANGLNDPVSLILGDRSLKGTGQDVFRTEREILEAFWLLIAKGSCTLVGFNCLAFDLPVLFVRSALLGVEPSRMLDLKPWGKDVIDLYHLRFGGRGAGAGRPGKLKDLARVYGIDVPAGDCDGSQVLDLWQREPLKVGEYVRSDIAVTRALHGRFQGLFCL